MTSNKPCESSVEMPGDKNILSFPRRISARLRQKQRFALVSHDRPDGDALGSMLALARGARAAGKDVRVICDDVPRKYSFIAEDEKFYTAGEFADCAKWADFIIIMDTSTLAQLESVCDVIVSNWPSALVIDHHKVASDIAPIRWIDPSASATAVLVAELIEDLGWSFTADVATAIMLGLCSDTGWFRFSNTDSRTMRLAGRCIDAGADVDGIYRNLYQSDRPQRLALIARALNNLEFLKLDSSGRRLAVTCLTEGDFAVSGAEYSECEDVINEPLRVADVAVSVLISERDGKVRCSLRSRPDSGVDVAAIAGKFGGGGHARAAGATFDTDDTQVARQAIVAAIRKN